MSTARATTALRATALLITGALLAGCTGATGASAGPAASGSGSRAPTVSATASPTPASGIPDGTWTRQITTAEITDRGLKLTPQEITSNYIDDGTVQLVLKTQGTRWSILVQDDAGAFEVGDAGNTSYDGQGRWVQSSDSTGSALLLVWDLDGNALTTSGLTSLSGEPIDEDSTHLFTEGTWHRQG